jgi:hypothetical protein
MVIVLRVLKTLHRQRSLNSYGQFYNNMQESKKAAGANTPSLMTKGWTSRTVKAKVKKVEETCPCPGITRENDARVATYLKRTGVLGGGARSVKVIASEMFQKLFSKLGRKRKQAVLDAQQHEQKWRNDHAAVRVFAIVCKKTVTDSQLKLIIMGSCCYLRRHCNQNLASPRG